MFNQAFALLLHDYPQPCGSLEPVLRDMAMGARSVSSAEDLRDLIARYEPGLIFVDLPVWNRSASSIISLAWSADPIPNVIVVGSKPDIELYVSTIERGAFSYIAPPFSCERLQLTVSSALADVRARSEVLGHGHFTGLNSFQWFTPQVGRHPNRHGAYPMVGIGAGKTV